MQPLYKPPLLALTALLALTGCGTLAPRATTEATAKDLLDRAVRRTLNGDFAGLCATAASQAMCESDLKSGLRERAPQEPPQILCAYSLADRRDGTHVIRGGQVLVVQGKDGTGHPYTTDVFVFHDGEQYVSQNTVWWSNRGIAQKPADGTAKTAGPAQQDRCSPT